MEYCEGWRGKKRRYALTYAVRHFGQAREHDRLFATVLDEAFQSEQKEVLGSIWQTLTDLGSAIRAGCENDRFIEVLRCAANYRRLVQSEGIAAAVCHVSIEIVNVAKAVATELQAVGAHSHSVLAHVESILAYLRGVRVGVGHDHFRKRSAVENAAVSSLVVVADVVKRQSFASVEANYQ